MSELEGAVAVVTGASRGIGAAIARGLAEAGADLVLVARDERALVEQQDTIRGLGRQATTVAADLREPAAADTVRDRVVGSFGRADVLVNCAGASAPGLFLDLDDEVWLDGFALKFHAAVRLTRTLWPMLVDTRGSVVNVAGRLARTPTRDTMIAGSVNAALTNFSRALANQGLHDDVNVNIVHPGSTRTERHHDLMQRRAAAAGTSPENFERAMVERQGIRRLGEPQDVAALVVFLASPRARHVTGTAIAVDGGATPGVY